MPGIGFGRNADFTWDLTAQLGDNSDMWKEQLNEAGTHYLFDGEWRELEIINEPIKVKGEPDLDFVIKKTHRGPILGTEELIFNAGLLFGTSIPPLDDDTYSMAWGGMVSGDDSITVIRTLANAKSVDNFIETFDKHFDGEDKPGYFSDR